MIRLHIPLSEAVGTDLTQERLEAGCKHPAEKGRGKIWVKSEVCSLNFLSHDAISKGGSP